MKIIRRDDLFIINYGVSGYWGWNRENGQIREFGGFVPGGQKTPFLGVFRGGQKTPFFAPGGAKSTTLWRPRAI